MKHIKKIDLQASAKTTAKTPRVKIVNGVAQTPKEDVLLENLRTYMCNPGRI